MRRNWLTSTTALALVLNAAAPIPGSALGTAAETRMSPASQVMRLAQSDEEVMPEEVEIDLGDSGADPAADAADAAAAEAEVARQAAEDAAQAAEEAAASAREADEQPAEEPAVADPAAPAEEAERESGSNPTTQPEAAEPEITQPEVAQPEAVKPEVVEPEATEPGVVESEAAEPEVTEQGEGEPSGEVGADQTGASPADEAETGTPETGAAADSAVESPVENTPAEPPTAQPAPEANEPGEDIVDDPEPTTAPNLGEDPAPAPSDDSAPGAVPTEEPGAIPDADASEGDVTGEPAPELSDTEAAATPDTAEAPEVSAEDQAAAVADETEMAPAAAAAAAGDEAEVVDTQEGVVTEDQARASSEEFQTSASGKEAPAPAAKKKNNDVLKAVGIVAAAGLGAYAIGKMLDNGGEVVSNTGDRAVVRDPNGQYRIIKDDDTLLRQPGSNVATTTYSDGSTRTEVVANDNSSTVTVRAADGRVLSRTRILPNGQEVVLFDDTRSFDRVDVSNLRPAAQDEYDYSSGDAEGLRAALSAKNEALPDRSFSLNQIRRIDAVRKLVPVISLNQINFQTGSAVIDAAEAEDLSTLGKAMRSAIEDDPAQVFLIEGHTDTVGDASYNLALSDRRAESLALALTEYFQVPPSNMIVQGYGEADLRVKQAGDIRANRRGAVRNITPLLKGDR